MYAEITFSSAHELPNNWVDKLKERIPPNCGLEEAIANTEFRGSAGEIHYWQKYERSVFLMPGKYAYGFKVHVENTFVKGDLGELKRNAKETALWFQESVKGLLLYGKLKYYVLICIESKTAFVGKDTSRLEGLKQKLRENVPTEFYVPVAAFFVSLARRASVEEALANFGIAIIAMALWIVGGIVLKYPFFEYEVV